MLFEEEQPMKKLFNLVKKLLSDGTFVKFVIVGVINTIVGSAIMFGLYNLLNVSYSLSTAANVVLTSILSYFLNKNFTFQNKSKSAKAVMLFVLNIALCYFLGYGIAKPAVGLVLGGLEPKIVDNISMFVGMCFFTLANYFGQKFIVFTKKKQ